ncbi:hypothetical protein Amac_038350 [Acrocarpospora macrocephala]|uniref:Uncharacterized protein n=1 Tax=Acrocarpospora macrocephala TaxID=150177 RepID=A0A5M3WVR6_9ACTN|nr:hypothetical protein Amac_038350 [Acrocarpospora macrocephala]
MTESAAVRTSRTRSIAAPAACRLTPPQENGSLPPSESSSPAKATACNAASSNAGCNPNPPALDCVCSGSATSANTSPPAPRQAARSPWNTGPYSNPLVESPS